MTVFANKNEAIRLDVFSSLSLCQKKVGRVTYGLTFCLLFRSSGSTLINDYW